METGGIEDPVYSRKAPVSLASKTFGLITSDYLLLILSFSILYSAIQQRLSDTAHGEAADGPGTGTSDGADQYQNIAGGGSVRDDTDHVAAGQLFPPVFLR